MRFFHLLASTLGICYAATEPQGSVAPSSALVVLNACQYLQQRIHADVVFIESIISQTPAQSSDATSTAATNSITLAFHHMIESVENATDVSQSGMYGEKGALVQRELDLGPIIIGLFDALQAIAADLTTVIPQAINFLNHSEVIKDVSGMLIQGVLALIDAILKPVLLLPFAGEVQQIINGILSLIPL